MKNLPYSRADRLADAIFEIVAELVRTELADPRLLNVQITAVRMTKDLRLARVNFHLSGADELKKKAALKGFESAKGLIKRRIGDEIKLKFMPDIAFHYDEFVDAEDRIEELLNSVK